MRPQLWHLLVLLLVVLLVFGAAKLPDITRNVGKSMRIFKDEVKDLRADDDKPARQDAPQQHPTTAPADADAPYGSPSGSESGGSTSDAPPPSTGR